MTNIPWSAITGAPSSASLTANNVWTGTNEFKNDINTTGKLQVGTATKTALISRQADIPASQRTIDRVIEKARDLEKSAYLPTSGVLGATLSQEDPLY